MKFSNEVHINRRREAVRRQRALLLVVTVIVMTVAALFVIGRAWDIESQIQSDYGAQAASYQAAREEVANGISR